MKTFIFSATVSVMLFTSCASRYMYSPVAHNIPVITEKGDSKTGIAYSTNAGVKNENSGNGLDVQGAYAISKHVAVQAAYSSRIEKTIDSNLSNYFNSSKVNYHRHMFELGAGYIMSIHKRDKIFFSVYGGAGFGKYSFIDNGQDNNNLPYSRFHQTDVIKYYLEPSVNFINHGFVVAVGIRATLIDFTHIKTDYSFGEQEDLNIESIGKNTYLFTEPAVVLSYEFKKLPGLRIECQGGFSYHLVYNDKVLSHKEANFSAGLVFDIPKLIKGAVNNRKD